MLTAEEFFRNKIKELHPNKKVVTLSQELITAEQGLRWAHEFKELHLKIAASQSEQLDCVECDYRRVSDNCIECRTCGSAIDFTS
jgi:ribosomal protein L37AE/L43A